jgi:hypothetical protein
MSFEAMLAVRAFELGRAQRTALHRHRALARDPIAIIAFELGAEPYVVGSIALGRQREQARVFVPGQPIDRRLLFHSLTGFARDFCAAFESHARAELESVQHRGTELEIPVDLPQVIVPNEQTINLLYRLGRRLAYLHTDGPTPADPSLPRLGRHLMWLTRYARTPGQQLLLPMSQFLRQHYATSMSSYEAGSLAALEAWIDPPAGSTGAQAAAVAEQSVVGPALSPQDAQEVSRLMEIFDDRRQRSIEPEVYEPLLGALRNFYSARTDRTWQLLWNAVDRERQIPPARSVVRRERSDRIAYAGHMAWMSGGAEGRIRARPHLRSNIIEKRRLEDAKAMLEAEEAIDDPIRMVPQIVQGIALAGEVLASNVQRRERINNRNLLRPSVTVRTTELCPMPLGSPLWWTDAAAESEWQVDAVAPAGSGSDVTLVLQTNRRLRAAFPARGQRVCFTQRGLPDAFEPSLPRNVPWTHRAPEVALDDLDPPDAANVAAA